jgi:hypothetical protein
VTVDPSGRFAFLVNDRSRTISAFTVAPNLGGLTACPGSPYPIVS